MADMATVEAIIDGLMAPAPAEKLDEWIGVCALLTSGAREDSDTSDARLMAYKAKLSEYPGDVVRAALMEWPDLSKWFPTWAELKDRLDRHMSIRPRLAEHVRGLRVVKGQAA